MDLVIQQSMMMNEYIRNIQHQLCRMLDATISNACCLKRNIIGDELLLCTLIYIFCCVVSVPLFFVCFFFHQNGYSAINVVVCNKSRQILLIYTPLVHYPVQLIYHSIYKHVDNEGESRSSLAIALIIHIMGLWNQICLGEPKNSYLS